MKFAIITITEGMNYGNRLQNYALQQVLSGNDVYTLYNTSYRDENYKTRFKYYLKKALIYLNKKKRKRYLNFSEFNKKYIKFYPICINNHIEENDYFDYYVCGSDQIWNANYIENGRANLLLFAKSEKTLAYAPSFGAENIPSNRIDLFKKGLKHIKYLSCREESGKKIVEKLTGRKDVEVLLDPTMLLDIKEWNKISKKPRFLTSKKYILTYFLGNLSTYRRNIIYDFAVKNNCDVINLLDKEDPFYICGPQEFLYLEKNAFLICTDSFHSCVFSILFKTPFMIFDREDKTVSMNSRLDNLLTIFDMHNRRFNGDINIKSLSDFSRVDSILKREREKSFAFLKRAIKESDFENE